VWLIGFNSSHLTRFLHPILVPREEKFPRVDGGYESLYNGIEEEAMSLQDQQTLFAIDCGATNWRLYRSIYQIGQGKAQLFGEPQISSLTSFSDRKLPAVILLSPDGHRLESFGEDARQQLEHETARTRVREFFKPCIGSHIVDSPQSHQAKYTHQEALAFTRMMLQAILEQIKVEKWRAGEFDSSVWFAIAYPVHWRSESNGEVFKEFRQTVLSCFPESYHNQIRFVAEPEGAIMALHRQGLLENLDRKEITLIADIGGSTTDIVAGYANSRRGELTLIGRHGAPFGGGSYDTVIAEAIAEQLSLPQEVIDQPYILSSLRSFSRRLKESLSRQQLSGITGGTPPQRMLSIVDEEHQVYRKLISLDTASYQNITKNLNRQFEDIIDEALSRIGISADKVGQVVLVGGGAQLFSIANHLRAVFGSHKVLLADNPEEIVVYGIALEYGKSFEDYQPTFYFTPEKLEKIPDQPVQKQFALEGTGNVHQLSGGNRYKIGRDRGNHIHLNFEKISRFHAVLVVSAEACTLEDTGSTNGTFVNGERLQVETAVTLKDGDRVRFGNQEFVFKEVS
jgi:molecular chaperone DnaK (HSP70)